VLFYCIQRELKLFNVFGLRPPIAFLDIKIDTITFRESFIPGGIDGRKMDKYVIPAFLTDEAIPFPVVEPFNNSLSQTSNLL
jgi:hypothetical protein